MAPDDFEAPLAFTEDPDTAQAFVPDAEPDIVFTADAPLTLHIDEGPPGPTGPQGPTGATGAVGPPGRDGTDGRDGDRGPPGLTGTTGAAGATGAQGLQGNMGPPGSEGPEGEPGPRGPQGLKGDTGAQGLTGNIGPPGPEGPLGPEGRPGPQGGTGSDGRQGPIGATFWRAPDPEPIPALWRPGQAVTPVDQGGTGLAAVAVNTLLYGSGGQVLSVLAVNSTATNKFLRQVSSGAPSWQQPAGTDITVSAGSYTPTVTQSGSPTLLTSTARYFQIGKLVIVIGDIVINATGGALANNEISISLPVTAATPGLLSNGTCYLYDASADILYPCSARMNTTGSFTMLPVDQVANAYGAGGLVLGTLRFTAALAANDHIGFTVIYDAA